MKLRPDEEDIQGMWNVFKYLIFMMTITATAVILTTEFLIPFIQRIV